MDEADGPSAPRPAEGESVGVRTNGVRLHTVQAGPEDGPLAVLLHGFHGGASTGPKDTEHLEGNDSAKDNPGGGAPELNTNAATAHGMWSDWWKVYERFPEEQKAYLDDLVRATIDGCEPYTPDMDPERRENLIREYWILSRIGRRADYDVWAGVGENPAEDAWGVMMKEEVEIDGETYEIDKRNPALDRRGEIDTRRRRLRRELNFPAAWQRKEPSQSEDDERTLAEILSED